MRDEPTLEPTQEEPEPVASRSLVRNLFILDRGSALQLIDPGAARIEAVHLAMGAALGQPGGQVAVIHFGVSTAATDFTDNRLQLEGALAEAAHLQHASDLQGGLARAAELVFDDLVRTEEAQRSSLRYELMVLVDGPPNPACHAGCEDGVVACSNGLDDDGDGALDASDSDCADADDASLYPENIISNAGCNAMDEAVRTRLPDGAYLDLPAGPCPGYNTLGTLLPRVRDLVTIAEDQGASLTIHVRQLEAPSLSEEIRQLISPVDAEPIVRPLAEETGGTFARQTAEALDLTLP